MSATAEDNHAADQSRVRIEQLTFTRLLVALTMVFFHFGKDIAPLNSYVIGRVLLAGPVWVSYFFVLSGFVMAYAYYKPGPSSLNVARFWAARLARLVPVYWLSLVAVWLVVREPNNFNPLGISLSVTLLQAWVPGYPLSLNYPAWALSVEAFFYACFPLLLAWSCRYTVRAAAVGITAFWLLSQVAHIVLMNRFYEPYYPASHDIIFYNPLLHLNSFLVGMLGGMAYPYLRRRANRVVNTAVLLASFWVIVNLFEQRDELLAATGWAMQPNNGLFAPVFLVFVLALALDRTAISLVLGWKGLVLLGQAGFALYMLHFPIHVVFEQSLGVDAMRTNTALFVLYLLTTVAVALVVYLGVEQPLRTRINQYFAAPHILAQREHP